MRVRLLIPAAIAAIATYTALVRDEQACRRAHDRSPRRPPQPEPDVAIATTAQSPAPPQPVMRPEAPRRTSAVTNPFAELTAAPRDPTVPSIYDLLAGEPPAAAHVTESDERPEPAAPVSRPAETSPTTARPGVPGGRRADDPPAAVPTHRASDPLPPRTPPVTDPFSAHIAPQASSTPAAAPDPVITTPPVSQPAPPVRPTEPDGEAPARPGPVVDPFHGHFATTDAPISDPAEAMWAPPLDEGRFALGGWAASAGHSVVAAVTYRRRLVTPAGATQIHLEIDAAENVPDGGLVVLNDPGFAPDRDGFTLLLAAEFPGPFSAAGSYRVLPGT